MSGTAILPGRGFAGRNFYGFIPVGGVTPTYPLTHAVYFNTTAIRLEWGKHQNANLYQIEVSLTPDFSGSLLVNTTTAVRYYSFTDGGTNDARRYWRVRPSANGGAVYGRWTEVGSYWLNTNGAQSISIPRSTLALINPNSVTDYYVFQDFPMYATKQSNLYRVRDRNRLGSMLTEYITLKGTVELAFSTEMYLGNDGFHEMRRFNEEIKTFYLAMFMDTKLFLPTPHLWKVQFDSDPELTMMAAGRQDLYVGTLTFTEV